MTRYAAGEGTVFAELYELLLPRLSRLCRVLVGPSDADDLLQEVFLKLHRARATFVPSGNAVAWSYAIARTSGADRLRVRARGVELPMDGERLEHHAHASEQRPDDERTLHTFVRGPLSVLSERVRTTYLLVKVEGLSCAEAAKVLGTTPSAVKQRVHRANEELRAQLRADDARTSRVQRSCDITSAI
jgi:RNA polymerase sigma-70 factor (ECF subfamily)